MSTKYICSTENNNKNEQKKKMEIMANFKYLENNPPRVVYIYAWGRELDKEFTLHREI